MSSREVRWIIQTSKPGHNDWYNTDETYTGWFYSDGTDESTESLLRDWNEAVERYDWLDIRLWKDVRSYNVTAPYHGKIGVIEQVRRLSCSEHGVYKVGPDCPKCIKEVMEWTA
jgi:hypothetical protein